MSDLLADANSAFVDEDYASAVALYSKAIESDASNPALFTARAHAQIKLEDHMAAVESCDQALKLDSSNFKAQFRRGIACWHLEEFETALEAFQAAETLETNRQVSNWIAKCQAQLAEEAAQDSGEGLDNSQAAAASTKSHPQQQAVAGGVSKAADSSTAPAASVQEEASQPAPEPAKPSKYRHQWLQTQKVLEVSIFAKKLTAERLSVEIAEKNLRVSIRDTEGEPEYEMDVQLYGTVDPSASRWELLGTKVEVILAKEDASVLWPSLEASDSKPAANWSLPEPPRSTYPTSSKCTVDWNKLEFRGIEQADLKQEEKTEQLDGDAGVQKLFKDIYGDADEDMRRAMNKSYQESNGTALSTNWKEIAKNKKWDPPENADVKKWEM